MTLRLNLIGAGKCGQTLGYLWAHAGAVEIASILNQTYASAKAAAAFMGAGTAVADIKTLSQADLYLITTPDALISDIAFELSRHHRFSPEAIVMHTSGALTSQALGALQNICHIASVHPANTFAAPKQASLHFRNTVCAMEGDDKAIKRLFPLFEAIGGRPVLIRKEQKCKYHIAGVMASNYLVTLGHQAQGLLMASGISQGLAKEMTLHYMRSALENMQCAPQMSLALTGPIQRRDIDTIQAHLSVLKDAKQNALYRQLGLMTVEMTHHDKQTKAALEKGLGVGEELIVHER